MKRIILLITIFFSVAMAGFAQTPCDPGQVNCRNQGCIAREQCPGPPPPPGLVVPIDTNLGFLLFAGLGLGIYFLVSSGKFSASSTS